MTDRGWSGGSFGETGTCVLAPNADVMTLDGTNTWAVSYTHLTLPTKA